jgi:uncharacterized protein (TIGR02680 family)
MTVTTLPRQAVEPADSRAPRWVPTRAGILNVWRYHDEVFEFHRGRLLLRGQNGSGKSKALELLLPFLFDANLRANRLSTFGTNERTMHWNLMGEGATGTTRVGYVWVEFGFSGAPDRWFSCGARLQASTHTSTVHADYFTTDLRVGRPGGLLLVNDARQPLTRAALDECLGGRGAVHANAGDYRAAVRAALFGSMGEQRYDALITALLQLRTPKLSQRLDPALLSTLLSRALPPLGQQEIADLAEGFERLDAQRERLSRLEEEVAATRTLASRQQSYARRVLRAAAATLISATTELDNITRTARLSAEEHARVAELKAASEELGERLARDIGGAEARIEGLTDSEAYRQGRELDRLRQEAVEAGRRATGIGADAARLRTEAAADEERRAQLERAVDGLSDTVRRAATDARNAAARAGLDTAYQQLTELLAGEPAQARPLLRAVLRSRLGQLDSVGRALSTHERAVEQRQEAEADVDHARTDFGAARDERDAAARRRDVALAELGAQLAAWAAGCRELVFTDPDGVADLAESEPAVLGAVDAAAAVALDGITRREAVVEAALSTVRTERAELAAEVDRLGAERDMPPVAPRTRTSDRASLAGAPLWRLVDFAPAVPEAMHGGIEAALAAAGLLDAWVSADGRVVGHDTLADPAALPPVAGRSLADVLVVEPSAEVDVAMVRRLLAAVAFGARLPAGTPAAVGADGGWRLGNLTGSWQQDHADHIGAAARERARRRRLGELRGRIEDCDARIAALLADAAALAARRSTVAAERAARPSHRELATAAQAVTRAESHLAAADRILRQRLAALTTRELAVTAALREVMRLAAEAATPTERAALDALAAETRAFGERAEGWLDAHTELAAATGTLEAQAAQVARALGHAERRGAEAADAAARHDRLAARLDAVEGTIGVDYRETLAELGRVRDAHRDHTAQLRVARAELTALAERLGALNASRLADAEAREKARAVRDAAAQRFRQLGTGVVGADSAIEDTDRFGALLASSDGVRAALNAAQQVAASWPTVPYAPNNIGDALTRLAETVHSCRTALSSRADLDLEVDQDVQLFTATVDGVRVGAAELHEILRREMAQSRGEITDQERELFDQTLTGDTRRHLADRIRQANELVDLMNARLERVRTASKVAVRLVWQVSPDLPPGTKVARDLLLRDPVRLTDADRESLHRFFRDRIEQAKAADTAASWEEQLTQVLDYTSWHRFVVKVDRDNGAGWQLLTKALHGALSGGEKAIALHLPLFAAVAAHYQAVAEAPRVILLDEVFVGVDSTNRGQVFALLAALDLDLVLTSDHEWCTYAELPGIGIHQLITGDGDDAVTTARFTWNGHELVPDHPAEVGG